jgi:uncharacterized 2Fe-2S/4Fe-4S cluster protein (DUF4445 family)
MADAAIPLSHQVVFKPCGIIVLVPPGTHLLEAARQAGLALNNLCQGRGTCNKCRVRLDQGKLSLITEGERSVFTPEEIAVGCRLACQAYPLCDCRVTILPETLSAPTRVHLESPKARIKPDPAVRVFSLSLPPPTLEDSRADAVRLLDEMERQDYGKGLYFSVTSLADLSESLRRSKWHTQTVVRGHEVLSVRSPVVPNLGLAVDLGTATIAAYLVDLATSRTLAADSTVNPQSRLGADIISRLEAAAYPQKAREMQEMAVAALNDIFRRICNSVGVDAEIIGEVVIAGNTAMHHILLGLPVTSLGRSPFTPAVTQALEFKAREIGINLMPEGYMYLLPNVAGFIGGDHVAALLATAIRGDERPALLIDIGTNTEISLISRHGITATSCASGPALEGAQIKHGITAQNGAIEHLDLVNGRVEYQTIGGEPPLGLCGSAVVDVVAALRRAGILDSSGRMQAGPGVRGAGKEREFVLVEATRNTSAITFTQEDVRQVQLAKGAIRAAIRQLVHTVGYNEHDIRKVILAGAFGTYLGQENSIAIGMLPDLPRKRFRQVGNAAAAGARLVLLSNTFRRRAERTARLVQHLELAAQPDFGPVFTAALSLP